MFWFINTVRCSTPHPPGDNHPIQSHPSNYSTMVHHPSVDGLLHSDSRSSYLLHTKPDRLFPVNMDSLGFTGTLSLVNNFNLITNFTRVIFWFCKIGWVLIVYSLHISFCFPGLVPGLWPNLWANIERRFITHTYIPPSTEKKTKRTLFLKAE